MEAWIPITITAAALQNVRSTLQKHLKGQLSNNGATLSRFLFGVPVVLVLIFGLRVTGTRLPTPNLSFLITTGIGGVAQILATALLLYSFSLRNFAVGTAFSKTEVLQSAIFGLVILGDQISWAAAFAILISMCGIVLLTSHKAFRGGIFNISAGVGLLSGALFAVAAICYRASTLALSEGGYVERAALTLGYVIIFQTILLGAWLVWREPGELKRVLRTWRISMWVGICGALASFGWFAAMTLQNAAFVKALGQVEMLFTVLVSLFFFREVPSLREWGGIILTTLGIVLLLLWR